MTSDNEIGTIAEAISEEADPDGAPDLDPIEKWPSALVSLFAARLAIISAEGKTAASVAFRKAVLGTLAGLSFLLCWMILNAALAGVVASNTNFQWFHIAFMLAAVHLAAAIIFILLLLRRTEPTFEITRSEFTKDRQWLTRVKNTSTSNN